MACFCAENGGQLDRTVLREDLVELVRRDGVIDAFHENAVRIDESRETLSVSHHLVDLVVGLLDRAVTESIPPCSPSQTSHFGSPLGH